ncbi:uncharacterized protein LOC116034280 isoform X4 [Sander lucioperca]|uniref:uncharacterized protein LOC116034280 isoform X4 n=1 Tax=Sander lucioperca TaxID=283035 RepID=UPI00125D972B|nr:uncharacterized protein LOC116034280 isoform X4 [Sander lucioperca]
MLKVVFVLGCLLSFALAHPTDMEHKRLARSNSDSNSNERIYRPRPPVYMPPQVVMPPQVIMPPTVTSPPTLNIPWWLRPLLALFQ